MALITRLNAGEREKLALLSEVGLRDYLTQNWTYNPTPQTWRCPERVVDITSIDRDTALLRILERYGLDMSKALNIVAQQAPSEPTSRRGRPKKG